jgi:hypothetical protein
MGKALGVDSLKNFWDNLLTLLVSLTVSIMYTILPIALKWSTLQKNCVIYFKKTYRDGSKSWSFKTFLRQFTCSFSKLDCFISAHYFTYCTKMVYKKTEESTPKRPIRMAPGVDPLKLFWDNLLAFLIS